MPTVIVPDIPDDIYEQLRQRADDERRTVGAELLMLAERELHRNDLPAPRLPDYVPGDEIPAPYDIPRSSHPVRVTAHPGRPRLPDQVANIRE